MSTQQYGLDRLHQQLMLEHEAMAAIREHFNPTPHQEANMGMIVKELVKS